MLQHYELLTVIPQFSANVPVTLMMINCLNFYSFFTKSEAVEKVRKNLSSE